jgi:hypothetical protein
MNTLQNIPLVPSSVASLLLMLGTTALVVLFIIIILVVVPMCLIFRKAGRQWWEAIIPFYNMYILTIITGQPWWLIIGFFIPMINWVVVIYLYYHVSKRFGFDIPFTIGLVFLPFIFFPILGFGSALYTAPEIKVEAEPVVSTPTTPVV